jgi:hypothetical protein
MIKVKDSHSLNSKDLTPSITIGLGRQNVCKYTPSLRFKYTDLGSHFGLCVFHTYSKVRKGERMRKEEVREWVIHVRVNPHPRTRHDEGKLKNNFSIKESMKK